MATEKPSEVKRRVLENRIQRHVQFLLGIGLNGDKIKEFVAFYTFPISLEKTHKLHRREEEINLAIKTIGESLKALYGEDMKLTNTHLEQAIRANTLSAQIKGAKESLKAATSKNEKEKELLMPPANVRGNVLLTKWFYENKISAEDQETIRASIEAEKNNPPPLPSSQPPRSKFFK